MDRCLYRWSYYRCRQQRSWLLLMGHSPSLLCSGKLISCPLYLLSGDRMPDDSLTKICSDLFDDTDSALMGCSLPPLLLSPPPSLSLSFFFPACPDPFPQVRLLYNSRTELIEKIYLTKQKLGLHFAKSIQPMERTEVDRSASSSAHDKALTHHHHSSAVASGGLAGSVFETFGIST
jgi:hypothetical protein